MRGYHSSSYGDSFADVYDDWYRDVSDVAATVSLLQSLAAELSDATGRPSRVLELGVGTGRLAIPLAAALAASGGRVIGIDSSEKMLERLASNDANRTVITVQGDMVDQLPAGPHDVVVAAYNTIFNLLERDQQVACFDRVAASLVPGGAFVVEAFVPEPHTGSQVSVRTLSVDRVVLSTSVHDAATQRAEGQFIEITEAGGVRLRPWAVRYAAPDELDHMATQSGLVLDARWADVDRSRFDATSERHVSVYRKPGAT